MYKSSIKLALGSLVAMSLLTGCVTTTLETTATMTQSIFIDPVAKEKRIVFLNIKNTSGQNINLESKLRTLLEQKGYMITDNPDEATFILSTNILYCDKKQENNAAGAASIGAGVGAGVGAYNHGSASATIGTGIGGALIGGLIGKLTEDTIYQMQVDINIKQKAKGKVLSSRGALQGQASVSDGRKSGFTNSFAGPVRGDNTGRLNSNISSSTAQTYESDYIEQVTMMFAEATKMNLKIEEAIPALEDKMANQIAGLF